MLSFGKIGTRGCSTSPLLCGSALNISEGRRSELAENPGITLAMWTTALRRCINPFSWVFRKKVASCLCISVSSAEMAYGLYNRILEKFYDAKYIDARDGQKRSGQELYSGRMRRNLDLRGENLHKYRKERVSKGHRSIRRRRYPLRPGDTIRFENHLFKVKGVQHNGEWVALASGKSAPFRKVIPVCHTGGWAKG